MIMTNELETARIEALRAAGIMHGEGKAEFEHQIELVREVLDVIRMLARGGMTSVVVTHEMAFARQVANRVIFMDDGRIVEEGPPAELFGSPREERTRRFLQHFVEGH